MGVGAAPEGARGSVTGALPTRAEPARAWVVCPVCRGGLRFSPTRASCAACARDYPQPDEGYLDLLPHDGWEPATGRWAERQGEMETAYRDLIRDPAEAAAAYRTDYEPFAALLATYGGRVLDIGGGNGLVRHYLARDAEYVVVDPSLEWLESAWTAIAAEFPCLGEPLCFVRGVGESLPFPDATFDGVLSVWSLNHAARPAEVVRGACRVLRPGGRLLLILDDVQPRWRDLADPAFPVRGARATGQLIARKLRAIVAGWPIQSDHVPIRESALLGWASPGLEVVRRVWVGPYLTLELRRTDRHA